MRNVTRRFAASFVGGVLRSAQYMGRDHLVVPVVMLKGNSVVRPMESAGPEFVPAEELSFAACGWDGRPVLYDHPSGGAIANTPRTLEAMSVGLLFNTRYVDGALKSEAYIDRVRCAQLGAPGVELLRRCEAGEVIEVSVGAVVGLEKRAGEYNGQPYDYVWHRPAPDHLAMLPAGVIGACSVASGCGAPRLAAAATTVMTAEEDPTMFKSFKNAAARAKVAIERALAADTSGDSDDAVRMRLYSALNDTVPGFEYIDDIWQDTNTVVYTTYSSEHGYRMYQRTFADADSKVTLNSDEQQVEMKIAYEPLKAAVTPYIEDVRTACGDKPAGTCACGGHASTHTLSQVESGEGTPPSSVTGSTPEGGITMTIAELVGRVLASARGKQKFNDTHKASLSALPEATLLALAESLEDPKPADVTPAPAPVAPAPAPAPEVVPAPAPVAAPAPAVNSSLAAIQPAALPTITTAQALAALPAEMRAALDYSVQQFAARRNELLAVLEKGQTVYLRAELDAKSTDELDKMCKLLSVNAPPAPNYSGRALANGAPDPSGVVPAPDPWKVGLEALAKREGITPKQVLPTN